MRACCEMDRDSSAEAQHQQRTVNPCPRVHAFAVLHTGPKPGSKRKSAAVKTSSAKKAAAPKKTPGRKPGRKPAAAKSPAAAAAAVTAEAAAGAAAAAAVSPAVAVRRGPAAAAATTPGVKKTAMKRTPAKRGPAKRSVQVCVCVRVCWSRWEEGARVVFENTCQVVSAGACIRGA
jgi:hypothetical protein